MGTAATPNVYPLRPRQIEASKPGAEICPARPQFPAASATELIPTPAQTITRYDAAPQANTSKQKRAARQVAKFALVSPFLGIARTARAWWFWQSLREERVVMLADGHLSHQELRELRDGRLARAKISATCVVLASGGVAALTLFTPILAQWGVVALAYTTLSCVGHRWRASKSTPNEIDGVEDPSEEGAANMITAALRAAGILKADGHARLTSPITETPDGGWRADVMLPPGFTVGMVRKLDRLDRLASALATTPAHLSVVDGLTSGSFTLTRYKILPFTGPAVAHPLLAGQRLDVVQDGIPAGLDINGRMIHMDIVRGKHGLIVSSSGNGKSQHLRALILSLTSDPSASVVLLDGKADGTLDDVLPLVDTHVDASMDAWQQRAAATLEREVERTRERQQRIRAGEKVGFRLIILDEFQMFTGNLTKGISKDSPARRVRVALSEISRLGRSAQVGLALATQSYDGNIVDDEVLNNVGWKLIGYAPSKMSKAALGEHADLYELDTSKMLVNTEQTGSAVVIAPGIDRYVLARGWFSSPEAMAGAVERVVEMRRSAGVEPVARDDDYAEVIEQSLPPLLEAVYEMIDEDVHTDSDRLETNELVKALGEEFEEAQNAKRLGGRLRSWGCPTGRDGGRGASGPRVRDIRAAVSRIREGGPETVLETVS